MSILFVSLSLAVSAGAVLPATPNAPPVADAVVAVDGSGQYRSLQEAIMAAPTATRERPWVIHVKPGVYEERLYIQREKRFLVLAGEDPEKTVVRFGLHANLPGPDGKPIGTFRTPTAWIDADDFTVENLTFENSAGPVGQALAVRVDGDRVAFRHCRFLGWQDTVFLDRGRQYFEDCFISGHVDFIFGGATAFFERCTIVARREGYVTAASTPEEQPYGFVFSHCSIRGESPEVRTYLGRPWRSFAATAFLNTEMSAVIRPEGWHNWSHPEREKTVRYGEYGSTGPGAGAAARVPWARPLSGAEAAELTAARVLGGSDGWDPLATPRTRPVRIVLAGDSTVTDESGWGRGFEARLRPGAVCVNLARGGRSSKSYRAEGHWQRVLDERPDYVLIQFGHNDMPGKGPERETDPATTFRDNLARYVDEARAAGATPVLVSSMTRRLFDSDGRIHSNLQAYADATKAVAAAKDVLLIDLHALSITRLDEMGAAAAARLEPVGPDGKPDHTHLDAEGSLLFGGMVADELRRVVPQLAGLIEAAR